MKMLFEVSSADISKWAFLDKLSKETLQSMEKFKITNDRVYVATRDKRLLVFGQNKHADLGLGHSRQLSKEKEIKELAGETIKDIVVGQQLKLVLTESGKLYGWKRKHWQRPKLLFNPEKEIIDSVKVGFSHMLALNTRGQVFVWGNNRQGQLGTGDYLKVSKPKLLTTIDEPVAKIEAGHCYSLLITTSGRLFAFGSNSCHQIDSSIALTRSRPTEIVLPAGGRVECVAAGIKNALLLTTDGRVLMTGLDKDDAQQPGGAHCFNSIAFEGRPIITHLFAVDFEPSHRSIYYDYAWNYYVRERLNIHGRTMFVACNSTADDCFVWGDLDDRNYIHRPIRSRLPLLDVFWEYGPKKGAKTTKIAFFPRMLTWRYLEPVKTNSLIAERVARSFVEPGSSDLTLKLPDRQLKVHKFILQISSDYMNKFLLEHEGETTIDMGDQFKTSTFFNYINWLYVQEIFGIDFAGKRDLLKLAMEYGETELKEKTIEAIVRDHLELPGDKLFELFDICTEFNLSELVKFIDSFVLRHHTVLVKRPDYKKIFKRLDILKANLL